MLELNHLEATAVHGDVEQGKKPSPYIWLAAEMGADGVKERNIEALVLLFKMSPILWPLAFLGNTETMTNNKQQPTNNNYGDSVVVHPLLTYLPCYQTVQLCSGCINIAFNFFQRVTTTDATSSLFGLYVLPTPERPKTRATRMRKRLLKIACNLFVGFLAIEMLCKITSSTLCSQ